MKIVYKFVAITAIVFSLCFAVSTIGYRIVDPSIISIRVVRYGFPITWLKATTIILPPSPTRYTVLWFELFINVVFYLTLCLMISFVAVKPIKHLATLANIFRIYLPNNTQEPSKGD